MSQTIRRFLFFEGASFVVAALAHAGVLVDGYEDAGAATAESVIGGVLLIAWGLTWAWPARTRPIGLAAQAFALLGTLVGTYLSIIGVGPHTVPDIVYHVTILIVLVWGVAVAARGAGRPGETARMTAVTVVHTLTRATGLVQLALGLAFWTGTLLIAIPFHMLNGLLFVLLLEAQVGLAAWAGAPRQLVILAFAWGLFVPVLGFQQSQILPGTWHWLVQVAHLAVGLVAMSLAERLALAARAGLRDDKGRPIQATPEFARRRTP